MGCGGYIPSVASTERCLPVMGIITAESVPSVMWMMIVCRLLWHLCFVFFSSMVWVNWCELCFEQNGIVLGSAERFLMEFQNFYLNTDMLFVFIRLGN